MTESMLNKLKLLGACDFDIAMVGKLWFDLYTSGYPMFITKNGCQLNAEWYVDQVLQWYIQDIDKRLNADRRLALRYIKDTNILGVNATDILCRENLHKQIVQHITDTLEWYSNRCVDSGRTVKEELEYILKRYITSALTIYNDDSISVYSWYRTSKRYILDINIDGDKISMSVREFNTLISNEVSEYCFKQVRVNRAGEGKHIMTVNECCLCEVRNSRIVGKGISIHIISVSNKIKSDNIRWTSADGMVELVIQNGSHI